MLNKGLKRFCFALDLKEDEEAINEYKSHHQEVPQAILDSIREAGIRLMDIYLIGNRLFMIMEVDEIFSFDQKAHLDAENPEVQKWEKLMGEFQKELPWAKPGEKWVLMERIFSL
ncbi:MAG: L-rhamnose mutarotase [Cyclobacteriaceae bacterium]